MNRFEINRRNAKRGFSLIEVLIAVVVLSVGLLALGALQASLVRNSSETKARSGALALAEDRLEELRSFTSRDEYLAITNAEEALANEDQTIDASRGGVDYRRSTTVSRYGFDRTTGTFLEVADLTAPLSSLNAGSTVFVSGREFKRVEVGVEWTDPIQGNRRVQVTDIISAASPDESAQVLQQRKVGDRRPQVLINNPSLEGGVIPIAIDAEDGGRETAATNPRPVIVGQGNNASVVETRFDVLTFQDESNLLSQVQKRVETSVIGCQCTPGAAQDEIAYRPAFWDGLKYRQPEKASFDPPASPAKVTQSTLCTRCCADHHDKDAASGPKFDPFRADAHDHYRYDKGSLVIAKANETFVEACRMIRVDGIWHTATDMNSEFFGFLATSGSPTAAEPLPNTTATTSFQDFVIDYLYKTRVQGTTTDANQLAESFGLNEPAKIEITKPSGSPACPGAHCRFLHARGVYIDHLEQLALDRVKRALDECENSGSARVFCILPYLPFTSINTTELSRWASGNNAVVAVTNTGPQIFGDAKDPKAGRVNSFSTSPVGSGTNISSVMGKSNAGVALYSAIDPGDAVTLSDAQNFVVSDGSPPPQTGKEFIVSAVYPNATGARIPGVAWKIGASASDCSSPGGNPVDGVPINFACATDSQLNVAVDVTVGSYNKSASFDAQNPCQTNKTALKPACFVYDIASVSGSVASTTVSNNDKLSETTLIRFTTVAPDEIITVTFSDPKYVEATLHTCGGPGNNTVTWTDPCQ